MSGDISGCLSWGNAAVMQWVEARDAVKCPTVHRTATPQQRILQPRMSVVLRLRTLKALMFASFVFLLQPPQRFVSHSICKTHIHILTIWYYSC